MCGANSMSRMSVSVTQRLARRVASRQRCFADCGWCWRSTCAGARTTPADATTGPGLQCRRRPAAAAPLLLPLSRRQWVQSQTALG